MSARQALLSSFDRGVTEVRIRTRQVFSAYASGNRKLLAATALIVLFLLYWWPSGGGWYSQWSVGVHSGPSYTCLSERLQAVSGELAHAHVGGAVRHFPLAAGRDYGAPPELDFVPFVGNGHFGAAVAGPDAALRIAESTPGELSLDTGLSVSLKADMHMPNVDVAVGSAVHFDEGAATVFKCYSTGAGECVTLESRLYAHRTLSELLVQTVTVHNPLDRTVELRLSRDQQPAGVDNRAEKLDSGQSVQVLSKKMEVDDGQAVVVSVVLPSYTTTLAIRGRSSESYRFTTAIRISEPSKMDLYESTKKTTESAALQALTKALALPATQIDAAHTAGWSRLWTVGFSVSASLAPQTLNDDRVNATRYALLSNAKAPTMEHKVAEEPSNISSTTKRLEPSELCYNTHNTLLYPSALWADMSSVKALVHSAYVWRLTLEKAGCGKMMQAAGAEGVAQAVVQSFGALKFTHHHLELSVRPDELHRDFAFTNISLGSRAPRVNVWIQVADDNTARLYAATAESPPAGALYACDAGCLDEPVRLKAQRTMFPVKMTEPLTSILYVAASERHIRDLKHAIHVREVALAPAHEAHVLSLHRHGHRFAGLPSSFWVALIILVVIFHAVLIKLVYNEWSRSADARPYSRECRQNTEASKKKEKK